MKLLKMNIKLSYDLEFEILIWVIYYVVTNPYILAPNPWLHTCPTQYYFSPPRAQVLLSKPVPVSTSVARSLIINNHVVKVFRK